jgi:coenzyme F420 biosynthesis associated uncharacterized protein
VAPAAPATGPAPVDWAVAARVAGRLVRSGPAVGRAELVDLVGDLRRAAQDAVGHVVAVTEMVPAVDADGPVSRVLVVDRADWARANTEMLASLTADLPVGTDERRPSRTTRLAGGVQVGGVLAALSGRVLGQFDPFSPARPPSAAGGPARGRLLLVAPNVLHVERALRVDPGDFRLWVALHEQTHALQFAAAPWLAEHLRARMASVVAGLTDDGGDGADADGSGRSLLAGAVRVARGTDSGVTALLPPDARRVVDEVGAVMALLEGHADVAMDAVGRSVVPSVRQIRTRFEKRRSGSRGVTALVLRRVLGLDLKLAQYRDGARFVRRVRRAVGTEGLNAVWTGPGNLPSAHEIADPRGWVRRVHG